MTVLFPSTDCTSGPPVWQEAEQAWILTGYADVNALLRTSDAQVLEFQSRIETIGRRAGRDYACLVRLLSGILFFRNPPWHTRARGWLRRGFAALGPRMTESQLTPVIEQAAACLARNGHDRFDVVSQLADRVPVLVMAHILGLSEPAVETLHRHGKGIVNAWQRALPLRAYNALQEQSAEIDATLRQEIQHARRNGGPLMSFLDVDHEFDDGEIVGMLFGIIMAGIETTSALLASTVLAAAVAPPDPSALRDGTVSERSYVDEVLRMAPPLRKPSRRRLAAAQDFSGVTIPADGLVGIDILAAQRDVTVYTDPQKFDPGRASPPLLAFGAGVHACLGGHLAILEARLLLRFVLKWGLVLPEAAAVDWDPDPTFCRLRRLELEPKVPSDWNCDLPC